MSKCYVNPDRERDCANCHSVSCNREQAEAVEATESVGTVSEPKTIPIYGMCWLLPDREADCMDCHTMSCPVNTGNATYDMLFGKE